MSQTDKIHDPISMALQEITRVTGLTYSVTDADRSVFKFGRQLSLTSETPTTIADLGVGEVDETYVSTNAIGWIMSTSTADTGATKTIEISGMTVSGGDFTRSVQTVVMDGQTPVALDTPLVRVNRIKNVGSAEVVGTISVTSAIGQTLGVPTDPTDTHITIQPGTQQSFKTATCTASDEYMLVFEVGGSVERGGGATAAVDFDLLVRAPGGVFLEKFPYSAQSGSSTADLHHDVAILVPPNGDVLVRGTSNANGVKANAHFSGYFALLRA